MPCKTGTLCSYKSPFEVELHRRDAAKNQEEPEKSWPTKVFWILLKWQNQAKIPAKISESHQDRHSSWDYSLSKYRKLNQITTGKPNKTESLHFTVRVLLSPSAKAGWRMGSERRSSRKLCIVYIYLSMLHIRSYYFLMLGLTKVNFIC